MARKKKLEEHENHERWLVSYADFITLLFAFFVVMYSISSVNEGKFRVLSNAMVAAFHTPAKSIAPIQVGKMVRSPHEFAQDVMQAPVAVAPTPIRISLPVPAAVDMEPIRVDTKGSGMIAHPPQASARHEPSGIANHGPPDATHHQVEVIAREVEGALKALINTGKVRVRRSRLWLEVEINTSILFASGSGQLMTDARPVLEKLGGILVPFPNLINVEGFTDNLPISTSVYPSNWELSAGRAATVVRLFAEFGVAPQRMTSIGYGEYRPSGDNATAVGRAANRRVVVVVLADVNSAGRTFGKTADTATDKAGGKVEIEGLPTRGEEAAGPAVDRLGASPPQGLL
jgi:chemotaxis protein MotB